MAQISFEGRLTDDATIKYSNDGKPRAEFTVAENFRRFNKDKNEWEDEGATFHNVTVFGRHAEDPGLVKGAIVAITGTQKSRAYTNQNGENRQWTATTTNSVAYVPRRQQGQSAPSPQGEQWNQAAPQPQQSYGAPAADPWGDQPTF